MTSQKVAVALAFVVAALSLALAGLRLFRDGTIDVVVLAGGLFMLALAIGGYRRIRSSR